MCFSLFLICCVFVLTYKEAVDRFPTQDEIVRGRTTGFGSLLARELEAGGTQIREVDVRQMDVRQVVNIKPQTLLWFLYIFKFIVYGLL